MRHRLRLLIALSSGVLLLPARAQGPSPAQRPDSRPVRVPELALAYDLVGSNAPAGQCGCFVLNGGSVTAAFPIPYKLSAVGRLSATHAGNVNGTTYDLTLFSYTFGVRYTTAVLSDKLSLFAQGLLGASHASGSLVGGSNPGATNAGGSLAASIGGGLDVHWKRSISVRAIEADYQPTTFNNSTTALQNNYRISAGLVFHPGAR